MKRWTFASADRKVEALQQERHKDATSSDAILHNEEGGRCRLEQRAFHKVAVFASLRASRELTDSEKVLTKFQQIVDRIRVLSTAIDAISKHLQLAKSMAEPRPSGCDRRTVVALTSEIDATAYVCGSPCDFTGPT